MRPELQQGRPDNLQSAASLEPLIPELGGCDENSESWIVAGYFAVTAREVWSRRIAMMNAASAWSVCLSSFWIIASLKREQRREAGQSASSG